MHATHLKRRVHLFLFPRRLILPEPAMKLSSLLALMATSPLFAAASTGGYFSDGWDPDAPSTSTLTTPIESATSPVASSTSPSSPWFDWTRLVTSGPIHDLLTRAGVNVTQHLKAATQRANEKPWDTRVPMVTDENWEDMVVNEPLSLEEEKDRTWFMVVCVLPVFFCSPQRAYNAPPVRWARPQTRLASTSTRNSTAHTTSLSSTKTSPTCASAASIISL